MNKEEMISLWDRHLLCEFQAHDADATLETMVDNPYVNHVPVLTGGYGKEALRRFYSTDFIPVMPPDMKIDAISRTVGDDQIVDEMIISFTRTRHIPWMLPLVEPTGRPVRIPLVAIVHFRDGKVAHEHIYWDQASVLKQIGLLADPSLPVYGAETAEKVLNPHHQFPQPAAG
jgi:carboxymethylenebutenolidase